MIDGKRGQEEFAKNQKTVKSCRNSMIEKAKPSDISLVPGAEFLKFTPF